jgi:hypothetical protein
MPAKSEFDRLVKELRPTIAPRFTSKRKRDCTAEQWAAKLNYLRERRRQDRVREWAKAYNRLYRERNAKRLLDAQRERRRLDADRLREWHKAYSQRRRDARRAYEQEVLRHRTEHVLAGRLRSRLWAALRAAGAGKEVSAVSDSGMTAKQLRAHIEAQFDAGMTWENWGTAEGCWHVDHWFPLAAANLEDAVEQRAVCHFTNIRPMWGSENLTKNDSVDPKARKNFERVVAAIRQQHSPNAAGGVLRQVAALALSAVARVWQVLGGGEPASQPRPSLDALVGLQRGAGLRGHSGGSGERRP